MLNTTPTIYAEKYDDPRWPTVADVRLFGIHDLANVMLDCGYTGEDLESPMAEDYIVLAAQDPDVESDLPERGFKFWKTARLKFQVWLARQERGLD
jgi:hypothetical protein